MASWLDVLLNIFPSGVGRQLPREVVGSPSWGIPNTHLGLQQPAWAWKLALLGAGAALPDLQQCLPTQLVLLFPCFCVLCLVDRVDLKYSLVYLRILPGNQPRDRKLCQLKSWHNKTVDVLQRILENTLICYIYLFRPNLTCHAFLWTWGKDHTEFCSPFSMVHRGQWGYSVITVLYQDTP